MHSKTERGERTHALKFSNTQTLFLDRDGVINRRLPGDYVKSLEKFVFQKGALEALRILAGLFPKIVVVTNQSGIGRGRMTTAQLLDIHAFMKKRVLAEGGRIDRVYHCPHRPDEGCGCRKPGIGMAREAKKDFPEIEFGQSWMVGDSASDIEMGQKLGMKTVWIDGKTEDRARLEQLKPDFRFASLLEFASSLSGENL